MKTKVFLLATTFFFIGFVAKAQRGLQIGYVDMEYILENVPEYQQASAQLDAKIQEWKTEIELKRKAIEAMEQALENERPLLTKELIEERKAEIAFEKKQLLEYQQQRFGPTGDMVVKKRQLIKPVQDQVFSAIQQIGETRKYDFIFENSADALMLYSAKRHDISDMVLNMIKRSARQRTNEEKQELGETPYKSVIQAEKDREEKADREAEIAKKKRERQAILDERERKRDSARAARQAEYEARRAELLAQQAERKRIRDSINRVREEKRNNPE